MKKLIILTLVLFANVCLAERHGEVTNANCPYSCRTQNIPKQDCRDWRNGDTCYIEDLRRRPSQQQPQKNDHFAMTHPTQNQDEKAACEATDRYAMTEPYINIDRSHPSGNLFGNKERIYGSVEGICLIEAGYFEYGKKVSEIPISTQKGFSRYEFNFQIRPDHNPEIRVYNIHGGRAIQALSDGPQY